LGGIAGTSKRRLLRRQDGADDIGKMEVLQAFHYYSFFKN
jgi:hypothetical protein